MVFSIRKVGDDFSGTQYQQLVYRAKLYNNNSTKSQAYVCLFLLIILGTQDTCSVNELRVLPVYYLVEVCCCSCSNNINVWDYEMFAMLESMNYQKCSQSFIFHFINFPFYVSAIWIVYFLSFVTFCMNQKNIVLTIINYWYRKTVFVQTVICTYYIVHWQHSVAITDILLQYINTSFQQSLYKLQHSPGREISQIPNFALYNILQANIYGSLAIAADTKVRTIAATLF